MKTILEKSYKDSQNAKELVKKKLEQNEKLLVVTLNPEGIMQATKDENMMDIYMDENTILLCESVGIKWGIKQILNKEVEIKPGIEFFQFILDEAKAMNKKIYLYGAKEEVIQKFAETLKNDGKNLVGYRNGYDTKMPEEIYSEIEKLEPDVIAFALGVGRQEKQLYEVMQRINKGILIGVGGSFDVLSGMKKRAPKIIRKLKIEWLYRIILEPKRLKRFWNNNIKYAFTIKKLKRDLRSRGQNGR